MMKINTRTRILAGFIVVLGGITAAQAEEWYEAETAAGNPLASLTNMGVGFEYTHDASSKEKYIPSANWAIGTKTGRHDWSFGIELPVWVTLPQDGPDETGFGDLKFRVTHLWVEDKVWVVGSYLETEFDTAADNVQTVANQRNLMALGSGFIRNLGDGWAVGCNAQYGWSTDAGETNGWKSEWEYRLGIRKKVLDSLSLTVIYKGTYDVTGGTNYSSSLEPSMALDLGDAHHYTLWLACELPVQGKSEDYTAKAGLKYLF